jgi:hypothetical protein
MTSFIAIIKNTVIIDSIFTELRKRLIILVFLAGSVIRALPEVVAYPYPIGYDVINYYIPVITNLEEHWSVISGQLPVYTLILYSLHSSTSLSPHFLVSSAGVILYGFFSVSLFLTSRKLLRFNEIYGAYLALFVILQLPVLRTSWDLQKDIFALTLLLISVSLIGPLRIRIGHLRLIGSFIAASIAVFADKMVGVLFVSSLIAYALAVRVRYITFLSLITTVLFAIAIGSQYGNVQQSLQTSNASPSLNLATPPPEIYNPTALFALFLVVNGPLLIPGGFGFMRSDSRFLKVVTVITAIGSFSWLVFPDKQSLVADRWIFLFGIFLSIFAGYGILVYLGQKVRPRHRTPILCIILGSCAVLGIWYEIMPHQFAWFWQYTVGQSIEPYGPSTMQFNSIAIKDTSKLTNMTSWINDNTPKNALFIGENHWRGWMELELEDERVFKYYSNQHSALKSIKDCKSESCYLVARTSDLLEYLDVYERTKPVYQNELFKVYRMEDIKGGR